MYEYIICNQADEEIFRKQCAALEKRLTGIKKTQFLHDVDDSKIQGYILDGKTIHVYNDCYIGVVRIKSQIDLDLYF